MINDDLAADIGKELFIENEHGELVSVGILSETEKGEIFAEVFEDLEGVKCLQ